MDLTQTQAAESPSPSLEIISQNSPKHAYCDTCVGRPGFPGQGNYDWPPWFEDIGASGKDCWACAGIFEFLSGRIGKDAKLCLDWHSDSTPGFYAMTPGQNHSGREPIYEFFTAKVGSNDEGHRSLDEPAPFPDHCSIWRMRAPSGDTSSTEAFDTLKRWISRCEEEHTLCQPAKDKPLPHRVLKIEGIRPLRVRLLENCPRREKYACLSHRWGPQTKPNSLKTHNLDLFKTGVPDDYIYALVKDAIEAAFRLDLRFIWIDCYCIIQDDLKDWEMAAAQMASIYEDAFLTISATFSEGGNSMFSTIRQPYAGIQVTEIKGETVFLRQQLRHPFNQFESSRSLNGSLLTRGWVFQERLLSNRFIHFMQDEIFWECRESTWCECTSRGSHWKLRREQTPRTLEAESWGSIVQRYQYSELTFKKDRLPALAGIARRYGKQHGLTYLAGIWKEDLPGALTWHTQYPLPRPLEHIAPTWSWLSLPTCPRWARYWINPVFPSDSIRYLGCNTQSQNADIYAGSSRLEIRIEGPVLDLKIYKDARKRFMIGKSGNAFLRLEQDFDFDPEDPTKYRSVPEGSSCLLLIVDNPRKVTGILLLKIDSTNSDMAKYERIGYFDDDSDFHYLDSLNEFADYCGGSFPPFYFAPDGHAGWLLERAEIREVTVI